MNARKTQHQSFEHVQNVLIGDNLKALNAAAKEAELLGMKTLIVTDSVIGEASTIGSEYAKLTQWLINTTTLSDISTLKTFVSPLLVGNNELTEKLRSTVIDCFTEKKTLVLLFGGETTVSVKGDGIGGRNQELSLAYLISMAKFLAEQERLKLPDSFITYLSCGTDGQDGPTGAAGVGLVPLKDCQMLPDQLEQMISMGTSMLNDNNSNEFWKKFANGTRLIETGLTGTNVMDVQILQFDFAKVLGSC